MNKRGMLLLVIAFCSGLRAQVDVLMNRYDQAALGANTHETTLTQANVNGKSFGRLFRYYVDGAVYAQPLFVHQVTIAGQPRNVLYVATMNDKVYAFDGERKGPPLWLRDFADERAGITPVPVSDITNSNDLNVVGNAGIEGTPVIDLAAQSMYLVARTKENDSYVQRLHKLDLRTGVDQAAPVVIEARVPGSAQDAKDGYVSFDPKGGNQRPALALVNGQVVIAWASHEDIRPYHGWIMAYDAGDLKQTGVLCITPNSQDGGIWQSGRGPAVDASGALFYEIGNGSWDGKREFGNSVIKVRVDNKHLWVDDFYTPHDYAHQNETDADLGSSGPMLLADKGVVLCGNKQGELFLLDPMHLGGMTQEDRGIQQAVQLRSGRVLAGPSYWDGPQGGVVYLWNEAGVIEMLHFSGKLIDTKVAAKGRVGSRGSPGGALTVSSDGAKAGTGIVWATVGTNKSADHGNADGTLHAFNAETLDDLWNSEGNARRDRMGTLVKFVPPLVVDGKVYVASYDNAVNVYGLITP